MRTDWQIPALDPPLLLRGLWLLFIIVVSSSVFIQSSITQILIWVAEANCRGKCQGDIQSWLDNLCVLHKFCQKMSKPEHTLQDNRANFKPNFLFLTIGEAFQTQGWVKTDYLLETTLHCEACADWILMLLIFTSQNPLLWKVMG